MFAVHHCKFDFHAEQSASHLHSGVCVGRTSKHQSPCHVCGMYVSGPTFADHQQSAVRRLVSERWPGRWMGGCCSRKEGRNVLSCLCGGSLSLSLSSVVAATWAGGGQAHCNEVGRPHAYLRSVGVGGRIEPQVTAFKQRPSLEPRVRGVVHYPLWPCCFTRTARCTLLLVSSSFSS